MPGYALLAQHYDGELLCAVPKAEPDALVGYALWISVDFGQSTRRRRARRRRIFNDTAGAHARLASMMCKLAIPMPVVRMQLVSLQ
eukprot:53881-Pleurochrysis_carterae.AAC.1